MDDDLANNWLHRIWERRVGGLTQHRSLLVLDEFRYHKTDRTKVTLRPSNTDLVMIPSGMTASPAS